MKASYTKPLLPLRDIVIFPSMVVPLFVGREKSIKALQEVMLLGYNNFTGGDINIDEKDFTLWHPFERLKDEDVDLYKIYQKQSLQFLKRFHRETEVPFSPPDVFPEAYDNEGIYIIEL